MSGTENFVIKGEQICFDKGLRAVDLNGSNQSVEIGIIWLLAGPGKEPVSVMSSEILIGEQIALEQ